jgi:hypothetical protein
MPQRKRNFTLLGSGTEITVRKQLNDDIEEGSLNENMRPQGTTPLRKMMKRSGIKSSLSNKRMV